MESPAGWIYLRFGFAPLPYMRGTVSEVYLALCDALHWGSIGIGHRTMLNRLSLTSVGTLSFRSFNAMTLVTIPHI